MHQQMPVRIQIQKQKYCNFWHGFGLFWNGCAASGFSSFLYVDLNATNQGYHDIEAHFLQSPSGFACDNGGTVLDWFCAAGRRRPPFLLPALQDFRAVLILDWMAKAAQWVWRLIGKQICSINNITLSTLSILGNGSINNIRTYQYIYIYIISGTSPRLQFQSLGVTKPLKAWKAQTGSKSILHTLSIAGRCQVNIPNLLIANLHRLAQCKMKIDYVWLSHVSGLNILEGPNLKMNCWSSTVREIDKVP